jgi:hypothetical protein
MGNEVQAEAAKLEGLDKSYKAAPQDGEALHNLQAELMRINEVHKRNFSNAVMQLVTTEEQKHNDTPAFSQARNGELVIKPVRYEPAPTPPENDVTSSIRMEQALLRGGDNSL